MPHPHEEGPGRERGIEKQERKDRGWGMHEEGPLKRERGARPGRCIEGKVKITKTCSRDATAQGLQDF